FSLSFQSSGAHLDLRSFPTRRSSDLARCCVRRSRVLASRAQRFHARGHRLRLGLRLRVRSELAGHTLAAIGSGPLNGWLLTKSRSEEHTSELQSRFDLVCRLLLEKKK